MAMKSDIDFWTIFINMANIGSDFFLKRLYLCQTKRDIQIKNGIKYYRPVPTRKKASPYHNFLPFFSYRGHKSENYYALIFTIFIISAIKNIKNAHTI